MSEEAADYFRQPIDTGDLRGEVALVGPAGAHVSLYRESRPLGTVSLGQGNHLRAIVRCDSLRPRPDGSGVVGDDHLDGGDGFARYGAVRTTHVGTDYLIFDWSYQTDPGNPELRRHGGLPSGDGGGLVIRGAR